MSALERIGKAIVRLLEDPKEREDRIRWEADDAQASFEGYRGVHRNLATTAVRPEDLEAADIDQQLTELPVKLSPKRVTELQEGLDKLQS